MVSLQWQDRRVSAAKTVCVLAGVTQHFCVWAVSEKPVSGPNVGSSNGRTSRLDHGLNYGKQRQPSL